MDPETPSERVALVVWYMAHGMALSTKEVSKITKLSESASWRLMCNISRVIPIYLDESARIGIWRIC